MGKKSIPNLVNSLKIFDLIHQKNKLSLRLDMKHIKGLNKLKLHFTTNYVRPVAVAIIFCIIVKTKNTNSPGKQCLSQNHEDLSQRPGAFLFDHNIFLALKNSNTSAAWKNEVELIQVCSCSQVHFYNQTLTVYRSFLYLFLMICLRQPRVTKLQRQHLL